MAINLAKPGASFAWRWHYGLRTLQRAYESSRVMADKEKAEIERTAAEFQKKVDAGEASWSDYDDEGYPAYDYGEHLGELLHDEETVLNIVRLAFVISLHHFVEQRLGKRLPNDKYVQKKAFAWLKAFGWQPNEIELNELRLAANCAKHSGGASATDLYALRPDMFDASKIKMGFHPGYDSLSLNDDHVSAFFDAAKALVPSNLGISI